MLIFEQWKNSAVVLKIGDGASVFVPFFFPHETSMQFCSILNNFQKIHNKSCKCIHMEGFDLVQTNSDAFVSLKIIHFILLF